MAKNIDVVLTCSVVVGSGAEAKTIDPSDCAVSLPAKVAEGLLEAGAARLPDAKKAPVEPPAPAPAPAPAGDGNT